MKKSVVYVFIMTLSLLCHISALAQFPYQNTAVSGNDFSHFIGTGGNVTFTPNGAVLTDGGSQTRGFFLNDLAFTIDRGFIISFDYIMTGSGSSTYGFGDGLALVLFDGSVSDPKMGSLGSGLGYTYRKGSGSSDNIDGLTKGFLAVGIDLYGNFKNRMTATDEFRNGIRNIPENNHVTIRGQGTLKEGYPVLISQNTVDITKRYKLDLATGNYITNFEQPDKNGFTFKLRENTQNNESDIASTFGHISYRKVIVSMFPGKEGEVQGYYFNVDIVHGQQTSRIIYDYFIPNNANIKYVEAKTNTTDELASKLFVAPTTFKIGFTGSTGGATQKNIVRNISIFLPFSPLVKDVILPNICKDTPSEIDVLANSVGFDSNTYKGGGDLSVLGKKEYLEPYSFQFRKLVNGLFEDTAEPFIAITSNGIYEYNPKSMKVVFTPNVGGVVSDSDQIYFTIKNKTKIINNAGSSVDLGNEQFRSNTATVKLSFGLNCNDILMVNGNSI
ncbi:MAG: hypothetical protein LBI72_01565 [Flavobacteriaceae bacterium]|jgi:hypothetical protein|nr:hypothetical protein [Flavobacteriaceae bacterium]